MTNTEMQPAGKPKGKGKASASKAVATPTSAAAVTLDAIIQDSGKLSAFIARTLTDYHKIGHALHVAAVSAIWHAAKTGNPVLLNRLYHGLRSNDGTALRAYIRRAAIIVGLNGEVPEGITDQSVIQAAFDAGKFLDFKQQEFIVTNGHTSDQAKATVTLCEQFLLNPDGKVHKRFMDRNNFAELSTLGDSQVLSQLEATMTRLLDSKSETRKVKLSAKVRTFIEGLRDRIETQKNVVEVQDLS